MLSTLLQRVLLFLMQIKLAGVVVFEKEKLLQQQVMAR